MFSTPLESFSSRTSYVNLAYASVFYLPSEIQCRKFNFCVLNINLLLNFFYKKVCMDLPRIELGFHRCKRRVLPLDYRPSHLLLEVSSVLPLSSKTFMVFEWPWKFKRNFLGTTGPLVFLYPHAAGKLASSGPFYWFWLVNPLKFLFEIHDFKMLIQEKFYFFLP